MEYYRIRIDEKPELDLPRLMTVLGHESHVIVHHVLPNQINPHYHIYLVTKLKQANLRKRFKAELPTVQKSDYSIKACDEQRSSEYVQYMFNTKHGNKPTLVSTYNYDLTVLDGLKEAAKNVSENFKQIINNRVNKGPTMYDLAVQVNDAISPQTVNDLGNLNDHVASLEQYIDTAIDVCHKNKKAFDEFMIRKLVLTARSMTKSGRRPIREKILNYFLN